MDLNAGRVLGIVGLGRIGMAIARRALRNVATVLAGNPPSDRVTPG